MMIGMLRVLSLLAFLAYAGFLYLLTAWSGARASSIGSATVSTFVFIIFPLLYLGYCFLSSFKPFTGRLLLVSGIMAHLLLLPFVVMAFFADTMLLALASVVMAGTWFAMYLEKTSKAGPKS